MLYNIIIIITALLYQPKADSVKLYWNEFNNNYILQVNNKSYLINFDEVESVNEFEDIEKLNKSIKKLIIFNEQQEQAKKDYLKSL